MSVIADFLRKNTRTATLVRAKELLANDRILKFQFFQNARKISAKVQGNSIYDVDVIFAGQKNFFTMCSCPYNYDGVCKHIAAVLIKFQGEYDESGLVPEKKPALIPDFKTLQADEILNLPEKTLNPNSIHQLSRKVKLLDYDDGDMAVFGITSMGMQFQDQKVTTTYTSKGMSMSCSCDSDITFCSHMKAVMLYGVLVKSNTHYFSFLDPETRASKKLEFGKNYGIDDLDTAIRHVKIANDGGSLVYTFSPEYEGALPVAQEEYRKVKGDIFRFKNEMLAPQKFLPEPVGDPTDSRLGFGIILTFNFEGVHLISIDCFAGKYNKQGDRLISNFDRITYEDQPDVRETERQILELVSRTKQNIPYAGNRLREDHELQPLLREIFQLVDQHTFTYYQLGSYWNHSDTFKIKKSNLTRIEFHNKPYHVEYELNLDDTFIALLPVVVLGDQRVYFNRELEKEQHKLPMFYKDDMFLYLARDVTTMAMVKELQQQPIKKMSIAYTEMFIKDFVMPLSEDFIINFENARGLKSKEVKLKPMQKKLYISGMGQFVLFRPFVKYAEDIECNILKKGTAMQYGDGKVTTVKRDLTFENGVYEFVKSLHPKFKRQFPEDFFYLKINEMTDDHWFFKAFEKLAEFDMEVLGINELKHFRYNPNMASIKTSVSSGEDWFDVQIEIKFGDISVGLQDVKKAVLKQERYIKLSDGSLGILPTQWLERFSRMFRHGEVKDGQLKISNRKFLIIEELFGEIDDKEVYQALMAKKRKLKSFSVIKKVKVPATIKAELRPYQKEGLNWLNFLREFGWGGILADDMGLGKTLQILAFLASSKPKKPSLIVVPTTLMFNWENEIEKFCTAMNVYFHYGPNRKKDKSAFKGNDLVITTYGMVVNDIEWLRDFSFNYIILDESQAIKNPQSLRFKAVSLLKGMSKIALTGTPIENNTFDLYAQMNFVNPGLLGNMKSFKEHFSQPIDRDGDGNRAAELRTLISPFIIRRTKEQVATELPPKTEDVIFCTMEKEQRKVYDAFRNKYRNMLMGKIDEDGLEKSKIYVIEGLMKLRQICDSPELLSDEENYGTSSIKVEELTRNIEQKTGNHKIVVFSQFVSMLSVIKRELDRDQVIYEYLDGKSSSKARQKSVERFQEDDDCRVFLISLKAGGTGLNLTAADYVFLVDPWWNPAVEEQAIDRCYRIGQDKKVFAYRMICKDTIEEKILNYQKRKKAVAADIIQAEESFVKQLTSTDIQDLFS